jgi:hypothetical protein
MDKILERCYTTYDFQILERRVIRVHVPLETRQRVSHSRAPSVGKTPTLTIYRLPLRSRESPSFLPDCPLNSEILYLQTGMDMHSPDSQGGRELRRE